MARNGWTPLHYAAFADNAESAVALLDAGSDVNARARNKFDNTPLQVALLTSSRDVARVLLGRGADVNARQAEGVTALHEAAVSGDLDIIRMLLEAGADASAASPQFGTPRELAIQHKHDKAARLLSNSGESSRRAPDLAAFLARRRGYRIQTLPRGVRMPNGDDVGWRWWPRMLH